MTSEIRPAFDQATQTVCRVLCSDADLEMRAEALARDAQAQFEEWVRAALADRGVDCELSRADYARLIHLMRP